MDLAYSHVDVFSQVPFGGNSVPVFSDARGVSAELMLLITQEMRHFEAIFLEPTDRPDTVRARIFDLFEELPFAGHPIIGAAAVLHKRTGIATPHTWPLAAVMSIDYRVRKANGKYIKILRQVCVIDTDPISGQALTTLSICKDISNIKSSNQIGWQCMGPGTEEMDMRDILPGLPNVLYRPSSRELDVIRKLAEGKNSKRIAAELHISQHTLNNHRRNLLQRTGQRNSVELVRRMTELGWL